MIKTDLHAVKLANMLANNQQELDHEQYEFFRDTIKHQVLFELKDIGDDGVVCKYCDGTQTFYQAFWFVNVRGEGRVHLHTAIGFDTPFAALEELTNILKTDHEHLQEEAVELLHRFADEVV